MPGAAEYLDLTNPEHKLGFAVYATWAANEAIERARALGEDDSWGWKKWAHGFPKRHAWDAWDDNGQQIAALVGQRQTDVALKIWLDCFDCAWESARSDDFHMGVYDGG